MREALKLGSRIALLERGRLDVMASPDEFLQSQDRKRSPFALVCELCRLRWGIFCFAGALSAQTISAVTGTAQASARASRPGSWRPFSGQPWPALPASPALRRFPLRLNGTSVLVNSIAAPLVYVSATQINFQVPSSLTTSPVTVQVKTSAGASANFSVPLVLQGPAIFQYSPNRAVAQNADGTLNSSKNPAAANSVITVYLTGQGAVDHPVLDG